MLLDIQILPSGTIYLQTYVAITLYMFKQFSQLLSTPNSSHCDHAAQRSMLSTGISDHCIP